jgi:hypothetical protein
MQKKVQDFCCNAYHWYAIIAGMRVKKKTRTIPIRMDDLTADRLDSAAGRLSSTRAAVVRLAIFQLLPQVEAGRLILKGAK